MNIKKLLFFMIVLNYTHSSVASEEVSLTQVQAFMLRKALKQRTIADIKKDIASTSSFFTVTEKFYEKNINNDFFTKKLFNFVTQKEIKKEYSPINNLIDQTTFYTHKTDNNGHYLECITEFAYEQESLMYALEMFKEAQKLSIDSFRNMMIDREAHRIGMVAFEEKLNNIPEHESSLPHLTIKEKCYAKEKNTDKFIFDLFQIIAKKETTSIATIFSVNKLDDYTTYEYAADDDGEYVECVSTFSNKKDVQEILAFLKKHERFKFNT